LNLEAIQTLLPSCETAGLEINAYAAKECAENGHQVYEGTILTPHPAANAPNGMAELSIAFHLLIHINLKSLNVVHELLYALSTRLILISK
jgi:hypothetical protein